MIVKNNTTFSSIMKGNKLIQTIKKGLITVYEAYKKLPNEYQEFDYIASSGTQFIKTNIIPTESMSYDINIDFSFISLSYYGNIVSSQASGNAVYLTRLLGNTSKFTWAPPNSTVIELIDNVIIGNRYNMKIHYESGNHSLLFDGEKLFTSNSDMVKTTVPFTLFTNNSSNEYPSKSKTYKCRIRINGKRTLNLVPCQRKSDGKVGMYDTINDVFYTNSGTGEFLIGMENEYENTMLNDSDLLIVSTNSKTTQNENNLTIGA